MSQDALHLGINFEPSNALHLRTEGVSGTISMHFVKQTEMRQSWPMRHMDITM